jgi:hypothetical protein
MTAPELTPGAVARELRALADAIRATRVNSAAAAVVLVRARAVLADVPVTGEHQTFALVCLDAALAGWSLELTSAGAFSSPAIAAVGLLSVADVLESGDVARLLDVVPGGAS